MPFDISTMSESAMYSAFALIFTSTVKNVVVPSKYCGIFSVLAGMLAGLIWALSNGMPIANEVMQGVFSGFAASGLQSGTKALMQGSDLDQPL